MRRYTRWPGEKNKKGVVQIYTRCTFSTGYGSSYSTTSVVPAALTSVTAIPSTSGYGGSFLNGATPSGNLQHQLSSENPNPLGTLLVGVSPTSSIVDPVLQGLWLVCLLRPTVVFSVLPSVVSCRPLQLHGNGLLDVSYNNTTFYNIDYVTQRNSLDLAILYFSAP